MRPALLALAVAVATLTACDRVPTREWTPDDHDHDPASPAQAPSAGRAPNTAEQRAQLIETAWSRQCASCHGPDGRGDGPQGPMVGARDLTTQAWQASVTDEQLARSIRAGKGKMPAFDIPEIAITALIGRIRARRVP